MGVQRLENRQPPLFSRWRAVTDYQNRGSVPSGDPTPGSLPADEYVTPTGWPFLAGSEPLVDVCSLR